MPATNDYQRLASRLGVVRRAWKRAAALSGLAIVVTESIGIIAGMLFLDWLYQPQPLVRVGMWAAALAGIVYFLVRHAVTPLLRKIPDEQIALYIEENRTELDGVLITATEFGRKRDQLGGSQANLIDAVVREAVERSTRTQVSHLVDFSRLRKYGIGALGGIGLYVLLSVLFPNTFAHHMARILQPWRATDEDTARHTAEVAQAEPLRFTLSKGDTSLPRGSSFDFEATLSKPKPANEPVVLNFRPRTAGAKWQKLTMTEIEKLNGFQGALPDVSEDIEFCVTCGADKSETYHLAVYDPLIVQSLETATHFPDYIKQPDRIEKPSPGDVTALIGSKVTLRILTSTPLKEGQIKWSNGQTQSVTIDPQAKATASVSFDVKQDDTYDYTLTDVNGQQAVSAAPLSIHAVPDMPPTVEIKSPQSPVLTHMLGEVNFQVEAGDDFGVEGVDLVCARLDEKGGFQETRLPLKLEPANVKGSPSGVRGSYRLALEDAKPPFKPNDTISYHVESRDAKGQITSSPIGFIVIGYFEHWATWETPETGGLVHSDTGADLMALLSLVWELDNQKARIEPDELKKRGAEIASKMVDAQGKALSFIDADMLRDMPKLVRVLPIITTHVKNSHDALVANDVAKAKSELTIAVAIFTGNGIMEDAAIKNDPGDKAVVGSHFKPPALTMLEAARLSALAAAKSDTAHQEDDQAKAAAAAEVAKAVEDLLKKQDALIAKAQAMTGPQGGDKAAPPKDTMGSAGGAAPPQTKADTQKNADIAATQHAIADTTRAAADQAQTMAGAGGAAGAPNAKLQQAADKAAAAAKMMEEAARAFAAGKSDDAQAKAAQARTTLQQAGETLHNSDRDKLEAAIGNAEKQASVLIDKQRELDTETAALARDIGDKKPDQRQQRDLQKQAYQQTGLGADAEVLNSQINDLGVLAGQVGEPEAVRALTDAQHVVKRGQPQAKMSNAVIDLNNASPGAAVDEQKNAEASLQKIIDNLHAGSDSLATSREAQLNRAKRMAQDAQKGLQTLLAQAGTQAKSDQAQVDAHAGTQPGTPFAPQPGAQKNGAGNPDEVRKLAFNLTQLTGAVDGRQLVPQDEVDRLKEMSMDKSELEKRLAADPKFLADVSGIVGSINNKIEAELEAKTQAGKLFSSKREECPPSYRQFVNKYFEVLSQAAPTPASAPENNPAPTGQP